LSRLRRRVFGGALALVACGLGCGHGDVPKTLGATYKALVNGFVGQYVSPP
jgi:hypothetical protein